MEERIEKEFKEIGASTIKSLPVIERQLPRNDCIEKIVFILDICKEENTTLFQLSEGSQYPPLHFAKRAITLFMQNKRGINCHHHFALVILHHKPEWVVDFSSNPSAIINALGDTKESPPELCCDLTDTFNLLEEHIKLPPNNEYMSVAQPPYIVRAILIYGRSHCLPQFLNGKNSFENLTRSPYFFLDVLYTHDPPSDENNCEKIYELLCDLDNVGWCYIFEVARNATKYHNFFSRLLAHPLQRVIQKDAQYSICMQEEL